MHVRNLLVGIVSSEDPSVLVSLLVAPIVHGIAFALALCIAYELHEDLQARNSFSAQRPDGADADNTPK